MPSMDNKTIEQAAQVISSAQVLIIGAGAGMSVDAGIPAFRLSIVPEGKEAVPAVPSGGAMLFTLSPAVAWGKTGSLLQLFRRTTPHRGYDILYQWACQPEMEAFVITSNVDGLFLAAGFPEDRVLEGHGSMHYLQCTRPCGPALWSAAEHELQVDEETGMARPPLPTCPRCGEPARPNTFFFGDTRFVPHRTQQQADELERWLASMRGRRVVVVECGAGTEVPTIRRRCEEIAQQTDGTLIRINPGEPEVPDGALSIPLPAETALLRLEAALREE